MSRKVLASLLGVILVTISIVLSVMIFNGQTSEQEKESATQETEEKETKKPEKTKQPEKTKKTSESKQPDKTEPTKTTNPPKESKNPEKTQTPIKGVVVPQSEEVSDDYFKGALFIGDSRVEGFSMLSGIKNAKFYADKGLNIRQMDTREFVKIGDKKYTVYQALEQQKFDKIYIKSGVNELGWLNYGAYIEHYENLISHIQKTQPGATIYVMEVIQVTKKKSNSNDVYTKKNIDKMNGMLFNMVKKRKVNYLRLNEALTDESGYLYADAANDGVHLKQDYCKKWLEYLKTHTVQ